MEKKFTCTCGSWFKASCFTVVAKIFSLLNVFSIDVVAGAFGGGLLVQKILNAPMPAAWYFLLPAGVWLVYTADHLVDALKLREGSHTLRHQLHYRFRLPVSILWFTLAVASGAIAFCFLPAGLIYLGLGIAAFSVAHILIVRWVGRRVSPLLIKESGVGLAYAAGVLAFPWMMSGIPFSFEIFLGFLQFFMLALANLLIFSLYELEIDRMDGHTSFVLATGEKTARFIIGAVLFLVFAIGIFAVFSGNMFLLRRFQIPWLLIGAVHIAILVLPGYFGTRGRYRLAGDGIFLAQWMGLLAA